MSKELKSVKNLKKFTEQKKKEAEAEKNKIENRIAELKKEYSDIESRLNSNDSAMLNDSEYTTLTIKKTQCAEMIKRYFAKLDYFNNNGVVSDEEFKKYSAEVERELKEVFETHLNSCISHAKECIESWEKCKAVYNETFVADVDAWEKVYFNNAILNEHLNDLRWIIAGKNAMLAEFNNACQSVISRKK